MMFSMNSYSNSNANVSQYFEPRPEASNGGKDESLLNGENDKQKRKRKFNNFSAKGSFFDNGEPDKYKSIISNRSRLINNQPLYQNAINDINVKDRIDSGLSFKQNKRNESLDKQYITTKQKTKLASSFHHICHKAWSQFKNSVDLYFTSYENDDEYRKMSVEDHTLKRHKDNTSKKHDSLAELIAGLKKNDAINKGTNTDCNNKDDDEKEEEVANLSNLSLDNKNYNFANQSNDEFRANTRKSFKLNRDLFFEDGVFSYNQIETPKDLKNDSIVNRRNTLYGSAIVRKKKFYNRQRTKSSLLNDEHGGLRISRAGETNSSRTSEYLFNPILPPSMSNTSILDDRLTSRINQSFDSSFVTLVNEPSKSLNDDLVITKIRNIKQPISKTYQLQNAIGNNISPLMFLTPKFKEYKKIIEQKKRLQEKIHSLREKKEKVVKPLTSEQLSKVDAIWKSYNPNKVITTLHNIDITVSDLGTLKDRQWLNDNIMDSYLSMVVTRSNKSTQLPKVFVFTTHFFTTLSSKGYNGVRRWAKRQKIDVTKLDYVFIPINVMNSHWSVAVINNKQRKFQYFDSLLGTGTSILSHLKHYMVQEALRLYPDGPRQNYDEYQFVYKEAFPEQQNGSDCGVFACTGINFLSREAPLKFSQNDMRDIRRKMVYEIVTNTLLD